MQLRHEDEYKVAPVELFFDLIFVFAFIQLSHEFAADLSWRGLGEAVVLLITVLSVWYYTSWSATMIPVSSPSSSAMVLVVTILGLFMNASIREAFDTAAWVFIIPLLLIQLGRTVWTILNAPNTAYKKHFVRVLVWFLITAPLWVAGAICDTDVRLLLWGSAAAIELLGTYLAHPFPGRRVRTEELPFNAEHMLERYNLFLIIALGETVLMTGASIAKHPMDPLTLLAGGFAMLTTISLWALTFGSAQTRAEHHIKHTLDPVRTSHHAMNAVALMVAALVVLAIANEKIIHHPTYQSEAWLAAILASGGAALFLFAQSFFMWRVLGTKSHKYWITGVLVLSAALLIFALPVISVLVVVGLMLLCLAVHDMFSAVELEPTS